MRYTDFIHESQERGFLYQATDIEALTTLMQSQKIPAYLGFDATAPSLHVGNLVAIMWLRLLQKYGHKPLVLMGGATTKIGDPSGKDSQRLLLDNETIAKNIQGIKGIFQRFLAFDAPFSGALYLNNADWFSSIGYIDFLRDYGAHFSVNRMLTFESVKRRLDRNQPLSFLEFNYMILQAYDFLELYKKFGCLLQMGGGDQWGNIVNGVELVRRVLGKKVYGITVPLVTHSDGKKMGKSEKGAIWLDGSLLPPYDYWQFWRNTDDRDVGRYLKLFTDLPLEEIKHLESLQGQEINEAKKILANEATALVHGKEVLDQIHQTVETFFQGVSHKSETLPTIVLDKSFFPLEADALFFHSGLASTKGEARRMIQGGGGRINGNVVLDIKEKISLNDVVQGGGILSFGKKKYIKVILSE